jgi:hypothetical protein
VDLSGYFNDFWPCDHCAAATGYVGLGDADHYARTPTRMMHEEEFLPMMAARGWTRFDFTRREWRPTPTTMTLRLKPWTVIQPVHYFDMAKFPDLNGDHDPILVFMSDPEEYSRLFFTLGMPNG